MTTFIYTALQRDRHMSWLQHHQSPTKWRTRLSLVPLIRVKAWNSKLLEFCKWHSRGLWQNYEQNVTYRSRRQSWIQDFHDHWGLVLGTFVRFGHRRSFFLPTPSWIFESIFTSLTVYFNIVAPLNRYCKDNSRTPEIQTPRGTSINCIRKIGSLSPGACTFEVDCAQMLLNSNMS